MWAADGTAEETKSSGRLSESWEGVCFITVGNTDAGASKDAGTASVEVVSHVSVFAVVAVS